MRLLLSLSKFGEEEVAKAISSHWEPLTSTIGISLLPRGCACVRGHDIDKLLPILPKAAIVILLVARHEQISSVVAQLRHELLQIRGACGVHNKRAGSPVEGRFLQ